MEPTRPDPRKLVDMTAPSANPVNVPLTASDKSLLMMMYDWPALGVKPPNDDVLSVAPPSATVPVTFSWSYPVPAVVPPISISSDEQIYLPMVIR